MQNCVFFDQRYNSGLQELFEPEKSRTAKSFTGFGREKSPQEHPLLEERLKRIWLENLTQRLSIAPQNRGLNISLCESKFSWFLSQAKRRILGDKAAPILNMSQAAQVMEKIEEYRIIAGQGISPFKFLNQGSSDEEPLCSDPVVAQTLRYRWGDPNVSVSVEEAFQAKLAQVGADQLNAIAVVAYQGVFKKMAALLEAEANINAHIANVIIQNMLAFLTYVKPEEGQLFIVPVYKNEQWMGVEYKLERIKISSDDYPFSPYYAYGLMPTDLSREYGAKLLFRGTTRPWTEGGFFSVLADSNPFDSVGMWAFRQGYGAIKAFLEKALEQTGIKIDLAGHSLGGCLAFHTSIHLSDYIKEVYSFSSPALYRKDLGRVLI